MEVLVFSSPTWYFTCSACSWECVYQRAMAQRLPRLTAHTPWGFSLPELKATSLPHLGRTSACQEREKTMKPASLCSGVHGHCIWKSREPLGTRCQSIGKAGLAEGQRKSKTQPRLQTHIDWKSLEHLS